MAGENNSPQGQVAQQNQAAPGQQGFDGQQQQQAQSSHMPPPPLPPVIIPQNSNPLPQAITSPMSGVTSPTSAGGFVRRAAPEPNKRALYVGGLDPRVTEEILKQIFETTAMFRVLRSFLTRTQRVTITVSLNMMIQEPLSAPWLL